MDSRCLSKVETQLGEEVQGQLTLDRLLASSEKVINQVSHSLEPHFLALSLQYDGQVLEHHLGAEPISAARLPDRHRSATLAASNVDEQRSLGGGLDLGLERVPREHALAHDDLVSRP